MYPMWSHHLPTDDNICKYCQKGKPENEMTDTRGHVVSMLGL
ncbi:hypothetical protein [Lactococcus lactis]|nr:hypothetical protein [Lactococcus lactis]